MAFADSFFFLAVTAFVDSIFLQPWAIVNMLKHYVWCFERTLAAFQWAGSPLGFVNIRGLFANKSYPN
jgi:hypothetical protein